ncbi:MAG: hypothetical protein L7U64_02810 [Luminiphilus sp.]|nr:hypothetical protein [Luminiphilus sp.]
MRQLESNAMKKLRTGMLA